MKKLIILSGTILLFAAIGLTPSAAMAMSARPIAAMPQASPERPLDEEAVAALLEELKDGLSNRIDGEETIVAELTIRQRQAGNVIILDLEGEITNDEGPAGLRKAIQRLLDEGKLNILLNLKGVSDVEDGAAGELIASYTEMTKKGGQLKLLNLPDALKDLLMVTKFITVFQVFDNEVEAVASFN